MPRKRTQDPSTRADPRARYMLLLEDVMESLLPQLERLDPPVVYHTCIGDFGGSPDEMTIWYAFADRSAARCAAERGLCDRVREQTEEALRLHGYPQTALATLFVGFTSQEQIAEGGGSFRYFRSEAVEGK